MLLILSLFFLSNVIPLTNASNNSSDATVGWVTDPNGRGTFSLISSCLVTLGLCVWSAMHLNIPPHGESLAQSWKRNIKWGLIGVFAPELVVFAAWRQYNSAKQLCTEVREDFPDSPSSWRKERTSFEIQEQPITSDSDTAKPTNTWTMVHTFYAGMGGFVIDLNDASRNDGIPQKLTVTARGIAFLAKCGHLPDIHENDIADKSKADSLAKALACLQAGWMVVQLIGRAASGLPVTLLEVNVLGHVLCAFVIYVLWWHKPRQVKEPTKLDGDWTESLCAYMYMSSSISGRRSVHAGMLRRTWKDPELLQLAFFAPRSDEPLKDQKCDKHPEANSNDLSNGSEDTSPNASEETSQISNATRSYFGPRPGVKRESTTDRSLEAYEDPDHTREARWLLAADAVTAHPEILQLPTGKFVTDGWIEPKTEELVTHTASNWPGEDLLRGTGGLVMGMVLWFASIAYGAVHIAAWNDSYPSEVEAWLWRSSSIWVAFSGLVWLVINLLAHSFGTIDAYWNRVLEFKAGRISYAILGLLCSLCGIAYIFARIFLVVEAWISIRKLPVGAYSTPNWIQMIPHL